MLNTVSEKFKNAVLNGTGMLVSRLVFDDETVINADKIHSINYTYNTCNDAIALGSTYIPNAKIEIEKPDNNLKNKYFRWEIGLSFDNGETYEYCLMRRFRVRNVTISGAKATLETSSKFYDSEILYVPPTKIMSSIAVLNDISQKIGMTIDTAGIIDRQITVPKGKTCRNLIGIIFALNGFFAWISRDDTTIYPKWYDDSVTIIDDGFSCPTTESEDVTISRVYATLPDKKLLSDGAGYGIDVTNTLLTEQIFNALSAKFKGYTYRISSFTLICGNPLLDEYDTVSLEYDGEIYNIPVTQLSHSYNGGFSTTIKAVGQTDGDSEDDYKSPVTQALDTLTAELVVANRLIAEKATITELEAANAKITNLEAEYLAANQAIIDDLTANTARIDDLEVNTLTADSAVIKKLQTEMLTAESAEIGDLQAVAALFNTFSSVFGFTKNAQFLNLTAKNVTIDEAVIKDIIAKKITVSDLLTASAQAQRIDIIKDGNASISFLGATQQFYDSEGNVRVQIGQSADGNFSFIVRGADGKTALFDENGITENAVADGLIVDSMVSDNASISGGKINMQSLIEEINGSEYKLKTSSLIYDETGQSLNLKFTEYSEGISKIGELVTEQGTKLDAVVETLTDQGTSLDVINGQINSRIWQNDIATATAGLVSETQLTSRLSEVNQTIDSITSTVSNMQTTIDKKADGTTVTQISTQMADMKQDLSGFKATVSKTYATQESLNGAMNYAISQISYAQSEISQQADLIEIKVNKDGVISAINQSAEKITIDASKIDLSGYVTFSTHQSAFSGMSNILSSVASTANTAYAWTDEHGTNMTALRNMVLKWTNNAVSTSTYIQGGWIATNTITAEKMAIGLSGNIMPYGLDTFEMVTSRTIAGLNQSHIKSIGYDTTYKRYGEHSLKVVTDGTTLCYVRLENSAIAYDGIIPVSPDEYYVFSWYVRSTSHDNIHMQGYVWQYDDDMETQTGGFALTKRMLTGCKSGWVRYVSAPFKPSCNYMVLAIYTEDATTAVTEYIDCLQLEQVQSTLQTASPWKPNQATVIDGGTIWANTIQSNSIAAGAITANKIAAKAVTADKISVIDLYAIGATIGGFSIDSKSLYTLSSGYTSFELTKNHIAILYGNTRTGIASADYRFQLEGLNVTSPGRQTAITLHMGGQTYFRSYNSAGSVSPGVTNIALINGNGIVGAGSSTQYYNYYWSFLQQVYFRSGLVGTVTSGSDKRIKHDIKPINEKYIKVFDRLEPVSYRLNDSPEKVHTGFIAQDLLSAMENAGLSENDCAAFDDIHGNKTMLGINYSELIAIQAAKIKQLENKISKLEVKINENNGN